MAQLVFEFISQELDPIVLAVTRLVGQNPTTCEIASTFLEYKPCAAFDQAISALRSREVVSAVFRPDVPNVRYALINEPRFYGAKMPGWFGTIEYTDKDYKHIWAELLSLPLQVACLGFEEGVNFDDMENLASAEFPWSAPELVLGAVRSSGEWDIRRGVKYFASR